MDPQVIAATVGAIGGLAAGVFGALVTLRAKGIDRLVEDRKLWVSTYDTKLLEERLVEYKKLWKLTEPTSRRNIHDLDVDSASLLLRDLTSWYYTDGGMVLSGQARDAFFTARGSLELPEDEQHVVQWQDKIVLRFSALRTSLCEDMNSRRGPTLRAGDKKDSTAGL